MLLRYFPPNLTRGTPATVEKMQFTVCLIGKSGDSAEITWNIAVFLVKSTQDSRKHLRGEKLKQQKLNMVP
jgi:hypothetical protein